jgi:hypothetical protein
MAAKFLLTSCTIPAEITEKPILTSGMAVIDVVKGFAAHTPDIDDAE